MSRRPALILCAAVVVAGCATDAAVTSPSARPGAVPGGTLVVGITAPGSIDPSNAYEPAGEQVLSTVCEPLRSFDPVTGKPMPGMTASTIITSSGKLLSIRLRSGVHFQNGSKVISTDVRDELSRVASAANASYDAPFLHEIKGYDVIHGEVDSNNADALRQLAGLNTISNSAFSIQLSHGDAELVNMLGALFAAPVPRKLADAGSLASQPVCAGPYEMAAPWTPGQKDIIVSRFRGYYARNGAYPRGGVGYPDTIDFRIFPSVGEELAAYQSGTIDIASFPDVSPSGPAGQVVSAPNGYVEYVGLPNGTGGGVFTTPAVHAALSEALDRGALSAAAYGGGALPATGFFPPTVATVFKANACATTPATGDRGAAQATLAKAGVTLAGRTLTLSYNDQFQNGALARAIAHQWQGAFGLRVTLAPLPWAQYVAQASASNGFDGAFLEGWQSPYPSADEYLYPLFDSAAVGQGNFAHFIDASFDHAISDVARAASSDAARALAYQHLAAGLCTRLPLVPLLDRQWHYAIRTPRLSSAVGSFTDAATGLLDLREVSVHP